MARKKRRKTPRSNGGSLFSLPELGLPDSAKRMGLSVFFFVLSLIFLFSFFERAGAAGQLLFGASGFAFGNAVYVLPLLFFVGGLVLLGQKEWNPLPVVLALALLLLGVTGVAAGFASAQGADGKEAGGWLGFLVSWPLLAAFGFWVAQIIMGALVLAGAGLFWHLVPKREEEEAESLGAAAAERVKKIFEPKFNVKEVGQEPGASPAMAEGRERGAEHEKKEKSAPPLLPAFPANGYRLPPLSLLEGDQGMPSAGDIRATSTVIQKTFQNFDIPVEVSEVNIGPAVAQYAIRPAEGVKLSRITALSSDLALALAAHPIRIEAPIPGRALVGIEIPNKTRAQVRLRSLFEHPQFTQASKVLPLAVGRDVSGNAVFADLGRMPHMLVAGSTGSGKTIALNSLILSLLYRNPPHMLRFLLVDPKRVEFPVYNDLPHLLTPVIHDTHKTVNALKWLLHEMERRFEVLAAARARDIARYHALWAEEQKKKKEGAAEPAAQGGLEPMPYIVVVIDELADLMSSRGKEMEAMIVRLAQMARAVGIHLVLATQRPSVEVITGLIKANITTRVALQVASQVDSRTILDAAGAEKLLGQGDLLLVSSESSKPRRIQGPYVSDKEVRGVVEWISKNTRDFAPEGISEDELSRAEGGAEQGAWFEEGDDTLYEQAKEIVLETRKASASFLQRRLRIGYARAARLIDMLQERGVIGEGEGAKPRQVYGARTEVPEPEEEQEPEEETPQKDSEWYSPKL